VKTLIMLVLIASIAFGFEVTGGIGPAVVTEVGEAPAFPICAGLEISTEISGRFSIELRGIGATWEDAVGAEARVGLGVAGIGIGYQLDRSLVVSLGGGLGTYTRPGVESAPGFYGILDYELNRYQHAQIFLVNTNPTGGSYDGRDPWLFGVLFGWRI